MSSTPTPPKQLHLVDLIQQRRHDLGHDGRPLPFDVLAKRSGLPRSTVHKLATEGVHEIRAETMDRLRALATALDVPAEQLERAAMRDVGARHVVQHLSDDEELLLSSWREMSDAEVQQVRDYMRFLRSQRS